METSNTASPEPTSVWEFAEETSEEKTTRLRVQARGEDGRGRTLALSPVGWPIDDEDRADFRLMAAAPDQHAALNEVTHMIDSILDDAEHPWPMWLGDQLVAMQGVVDGAIARAQGKAA
jgi:hypothetical protein